jgi:hypothetical protein
VTLSRSLKVPYGDPKLHFDVLNSPGGDFKLVVRVNGETIRSEVIGNAPSPDGKPARFSQLRTFDISLEPWEGKDATIELVNEPTGWNCEAALWRDIRIMANSGNVQ